MGNLNAQSVDVRIGNGNFHRDEQYRQGFDTGGVDTYYLYDGRSLSVAAELREIKLPGGGFLPPGLIDKGGPPGLGGDLPPGLGGDNPGQGNGPPGQLPPPFQDPEDPVDEYSVREYVLTGSGILSHTDLVSRPVHKTQTSWYHADVRGSTMMLTGENGQRSAAYSYDAYGAVYGGRPVVGVPRPVVPEVARPAVERGTEYLYAGKRLEAETGQYDYGFRDYAARVARFTTVDPIRDGRNWYAYVGGDPVNRVDVWGLSSEDPSTSLPSTVWITVDGPSDYFRAETGEYTASGIRLDLAVDVHSGLIELSGGTYTVQRTIVGVFEGVPVMDDRQLTSSPALQIGTIEAQIITQSAEGTTSIIEITLGDERVSGLGVPLEVGPEGTEGVLIEFSSSFVISGQVESVDPIAVVEATVSGQANGSEFTTALGVNVNE